MTKQLDYKHVKVLAEGHKRRSQILLMKPENQIFANE